MRKDSFAEIIRRSGEIRRKYHELEVQHHGSEWSLEEDALAYLTDAGLVGRSIMSKEGRWPKSGAEAELKHKLAENKFTKPTCIPVFSAIGTHPVQVLN